MKHFLYSAIILSTVLVSCNKNNNNAEAQESLKDSLELYKRLYTEAAYFSIDQNENAQKEFLPQKTEDVMAKVVQDFSEHIRQESESPLIPGHNSKLHRMSVVNHKWLIVDFYNDSYVGELLIRYDYAPDKTTEFTLIDTVIY